MAGNCETKDKLSLIHVIYILAAVLISVGVAWGMVVNQQKVNCKELDKKLNKEVFEIQISEQRIATQALQNSIDKGFDRIDKRLEKLE